MFLLSIPSKAFFLFFFLFLGVCMWTDTVVDRAQPGSRQLWQDCGTDVLCGVVPDSVSVAGRRFRTKAATMIPLVGY